MLSCNMIYLRAITRPIQDLRAITRSVQDPRAVTRRGGFNVRNETKTEEGALA